jgi:hypothetical protein
MRASSTRKQPVRKPAHRFNEQVPLRAVLLQPRRRRSAARAEVCRALPGLRSPNHLPRTHLRIVAVQSSSVPSSLDCLGGSSEATIAEGGVAP